MVSLCICSFNFIAVYTDLFAFCIILLIFYIEKNISITNFINKLNLFINNFYSFEYTIKNIKNIKDLDLNIYYNITNYLNNITNELSDIYNDYNTIVELLFIMLIVYVSIKIILIIILFIRCLKFI